MPTFLIQTLGCKLNQLESEAIADAFARDGFTGAKIENEDKPSVVIINTCTVTSKADQKARRVIRKAMRDYPDARVIVTGCYAQLNRDDILKLEKDGSGRLSVACKDKIISKEKNDLFQFNPKKFSQHTRSFLKIQDGCDKSCTYCKIRLARGPSVSLDKDEVLSRLLVLEETHAEAVLTGVNICQYKFNGNNYSGQSTGGDLRELLDFLLSNTERIAIRLSSLAPQNVYERFCRVLSHPRIRPHFHLSVQSGSGKILERMGRTYDAQTVERAVSFLRGVKDDPFLACDIITGFPGETETEFEQTLNLCRKLDFAWIHVFPYSKRQGTPAFSFKDTATESEVTKRAQILTDLAKHGRAGYVQRWIGRDVDVLTEDFGHKTRALEGELNKKICRGTTGNYLKALVSCNDEEPPLPGTVLHCRLTGLGDLKSFDAAAVKLGTQ